MENETIKNLSDLSEIIDKISPSDYLSCLVRDREYDGQPHTDTGERGRQLVTGITMRDIRDCFIIGAFKASGLSPEDYPRTIFELDWNDIDPIAVCQNMICQIEKRMGIYPNVCIDANEQTNLGIQ